MHKSRLATLIIDSQVDDIKRGGKILAKALSLGIGDPNYENKNWVPLEIQEPQPHIWLQKVKHQIRIQIDIETDNIDAEVARLQKLGASIFENKDKFVVMEAPTRHRFLCREPAA